jgi:hypothetical protein
MHVLHSFILLLFILNISCHNNERMGEGIAYSGLIMMWWETWMAMDQVFAIPSCRDGAPIGDMNYK